MPRIKVKQLKEKPLKPKQEVKLASTAPLLDTSHVERFKPLQDRSIFDYLNNPLLNYVVENSPRKGGKNSNVNDPAPDNTADHRTVDTAKTPDTMHNAVNHNEFDLSKYIDTNRNLVLDGPGDGTLKVVSPIGSPKQQSITSIVVIDSLDSLSKEDQVHLLKEQKARKLDVVTRDELSKKFIDPESRVGLSYLGRKLQKLFPSESITLSDEDTNGSGFRDSRRTHIKLELSKMKSLDYDVKFANDSQWKVDSKEPTTRLLHLRAAQSIIVRETYINQLDGLIKKMDYKYHEYAVMRIQAAALGIPPNSEQLVVKKAKLLGLQTELRVAFANYRASTVTILEDMIALRDSCRRETSIRSIHLSLTWYGENYLKKMCTDTRFLYKHSILRIWMPFVPNTLLIDPIQYIETDFDRNRNLEKFIFNKDFSEMEGILNFYNEKAAIYMEWLRGHHAYSKQLKMKKYKEEKAKEMERLRREQEEAGGFIDVSKASVEEKQGEGEGKEKEAEVETKEKEDTIEAEEGSDDDKKHVSDMICVDGQLQSIESLGDESVGDLMRKRNETVVLQEVCNKSWACTEEGLWIQGPQHAPDFWNEIKYNPLVVETAIGLKELIPKTALVPRLPNHLYGKCIKLLNFMNTEIAFLSQRETSASFTVGTLYSTESEGMLIEKFKTQALDELDNSRLDLRDRQQQVPKQENLGIKLKQKEEKENKKKAERERMRWQGNPSFMTEFNNKKDYSLTKARSVSDLLDFSRSRRLHEHTYIHQTANNEQKVYSFRPFRKAPEYVYGHWHDVCSITIQTKIRQFLAKCRVARIFAARKKWKSLIKIQSSIRRVLAWKAFAKRKVEFTKNMKVVRDYLVKLHKMAIRITKFIRYAGTVNTGEAAANLNLLLAYTRGAALQQSVIKPRQSLYGQGSIRRSPGSPSGRKSMLATSKEEDEDGDEDEKKKKGPSMKDAVIKTDKKTSCRLIPLGEFVTYEGKEGKKRRYYKKPFSARHRDFDIDEGIVKATKVVNVSNEVYRTLPALMTREEREAALQEMQEIKLAKDGGQSARKKLDNEKFLSLRQKLKNELRARTSTSTSNPGV